MPISLNLKLKETDELNLEKKKKCTFPKAMLLSYDSDLLPSREKDKSGKCHDIRTRHGTSWEHSEFQGKFSEGIFFPQNTNAYKWNY